MKVSLLYRCRRCGQTVRVAHEATAPTLLGAIWELGFLRTTPGAGMVEPHDCHADPLTVGVMDLIGGDEVKE